MASADTAKMVDAWGLRKPERDSTPRQQDGHRSFWLGALAVVCLLALPQFVATAFAQERTISIGGGSVTPVTLAPGRTLTVTTNRAFSDIVVGNADVADVVPLSERSMYIQSRSTGVTNISMYGSDGQLLGVIDVRVQFDFSELSTAIRQAVPAAQVTVSNVNNRIRLSGTVKDGRSLARVLELAEQYSSEPVLNQLRVSDAQQVMLEVRIIEASRNTGRDLGVNWRVTGGSSIGVAGARVRINAEDGEAQTFLDDDGERVSQGVPFGTLVAQVLEFAGVRVDVVINALEQKGLARRLAQPNLVAMSGETASFHAGGEVPITRAVRGTDGSTASEVDYRPYGVRLAFTPTVLDDGLINLHIEPEVSEIDRSVSVNGNPGFISRRASTTVELRDGQSFALAGLLQTVTSNNVQQLPWLGQVPILGALFRSTSFQKGETDLVILVTPRIVRPAAPNEPLYSPLDGRRPANDVEMFMLGMLEVDNDMKRGFLDGHGVVGPYGHIIDLEYGAPHAVGKQ